MGLTKTAIYSVLDKTDNKAINRLKKLGVRNTIAMVIVFLDQAEESSIKEIRFGTDASEEAVSSALRTLRRWGWIVETSHNTGYRRNDDGYDPRIYYRNSLSLDMSDIIEELKIKQKRKALGR